MTKILLVLLVLLPAAAQAQTPPRFCRNFAFPDQGRDANGFPAFNMTVPIPPSGPNGDGTIYPVIIPFPQGALSFSLVKWMHWYHDQDIPQGRVHLWGFIDRRGGVAGSGANAIATDVFVNDRVRRHNPFDPVGPESRAVTIALSSPVNPGEAYSVGAVNFTPSTVYVMLSITVNVCFPSQAELDNYTLYAEPSSR